MKQFNGKVYRLKKWDERATLEFLFDRFGNQTMKLEKQKIVLVQEMLNLGWSLVSGGYEEDNSETGISGEPNVSWFKFVGSEQENGLLTGKYPQTFYAKLNLDEPTFSLKVYTLENAECIFLADYKSIEAFKSYFNGTRGLVPVKLRFSWFISEVIDSHYFTDNSNMHSSMLRYGAIDANYGRRLDGKPEIDFSKVEEINNE